MKHVGESLLFFQTCRFEVITYSVVGDFTEEIIEKTLSVFVVMNNSKAGVKASN